MDMLTLIMLANNAPRTPVAYITDITFIKVAPAVECVECALKWVEGSSFRRADRYRMATAADMRSPLCYSCGKEVDLNLDITR